MAKVAMVSPVLGVTTMLEYAAAAVLAALGVAMTLLAVRMAVVVHLHQGLAILQVILEQQVVSVSSGPEIHAHSLQQT